MTTKNQIKVLFLINNKTQLTLLNSGAPCSQEQSFIVETPIPKALLSAVELRTHGEHILDARFTRKTQKTKKSEYHERIRYTYEIHEVCRSQYFFDHIPSLEEIAAIENLFLELSPEQVEENKAALAAAEAEAEKKAEAEAEKKAEAEAAAKAEAESEKTLLSWIAKNGSEELRLLAKHDFDWEGLARHEIAKSFFPATAAEHLAQHDHSEDHFSYKRIESPDLEILQEIEKNRTAIVKGIGAGFNVQLVSISVFQATEKDSPRYGEEQAVHTEVDYTFLVEGGKVVIHRIHE